MSRKSKNHNTVSRWGELFLFAFCVLGIIGLMLFINVDGYEIAQNAFAITFFFIAIVLLIRLLNLREVIDDMAKIIRLSSN